MLVSDTSSVNVSVIVVSRESAALLPRCLAAIANGSERTIEVLVVDNASSDCSAKVAGESGARVIQLDRNVGFAAANNRALAVAQGKYLVLVNPDAFPDRGSIDRLLERLDASPQVGIVGGALRYSTGAYQPSAGSFPSLRGGLWVALGLHRAPGLGRLGIGLRSHPTLYRAPRRVDWVTAAYCAVRRSIGPVPQSSFMYGEDVEWARQAVRRGFEVWLEPRATAVHLLGESSARPSPVLKQEQRVEFELRWFAHRGQKAVWAARGVMALHALVRLGTVTASRFVGRAGGSEADPWRALLRAALVRQDAKRGQSGGRSGTS